MAPPRRVSEDVASLRIGMAASPELQLIYITNIQTAIEESERRHPSNHMLVEYCEIMAVNVNISQEE
jgi:hypothetical protein